MSPNLESNATSGLSTLSLLDDRTAPHGDRKSASAADGRSELVSLISAVGTEPQCYNYETQLRASEGQRIAVEELKDEDALMALDGSIVPVRVKRHASSDRTMMLLRGNSITIPLTTDHKVKVRRESQRSCVDSQGMESDGL